MDKNIDITLKVWRQKGPKEKGFFETYPLKGISQGSSFLEMLDILNEQLINEGKDPVVFDHDCREGICGMCSLYINGHPHGPDSAVTTCQLHMRRFNDGDTITIEPWRSAGFPVIRDLMVDRTAFDKIMQSGGFVSVNTGGIPDANAIPIPQYKAEEAMDAMLGVWMRKGRVRKVTQSGCSGRCCGAREETQYEWLPEGQIGLIQRC